MFVCAKGEEFHFAKTIGVGLIESTISLVKLMQSENPKRLIFIGSAGSYDKNIEIFSIFLSHFATQMESSLFCNNSYTPLQNKIQNVSCETLIKNANEMGQKIATINSSNYITTDESVAKVMREQSILLENMEFFSVLKVAESYKIPAFGIFCVTNYCDKNAHNDFLKNHKKAKQILESFVESCEFLEFYKTHKNLNLSDESDKMDGIK